jgi:regulator of sigma E protease
VIFVLGFGVAFGLAVLIHELGHFLAARAFGVSVERFVIGFDKEALPFMPACIWERKIGETTYGLSLVPLGGYVKMVGPVHPDIERYLDGEPAPSAEKKPDTLVDQAMADQQALYKKPFWQKFIIYSAGVVMNILLAIVVATVLAVTGISVSVAVPPVVGWQKADSIVTQLGLTTGDRVIAVNGVPVETNREVIASVNNLLPTERPEQTLAVPIILGVQRGEENFEVTLPLTLAGNEASPEEVAASEKGWRAFANMFATPAHVVRVLPNAPADKAGLRQGDTVIEMNGETLNDWAQFVATIESSIGRDIALKVERHVRGEKQTLALTVRPVESTNPGEEGLGRIGIEGGTPERDIIRQSLGTAITESPRLVWANTVRYVERLQLLGSRLFRGEIQKVRQDLGGPVVIAQIAGRQAQEGLERFLGFMIMLNIALAVMNILPFPVLDGGHIVFAAYEGLFGKPLPPRVLVPMLQGSLFIILAFFLLVTFNDVLRIFF